MMSAFALVMRRNAMNKKQIIIDGVDVSGCSALCCGNTCFLSQHYSFTEPKHKTFCVANPNCYFKQLARNTQRIKDLEERIINHSNEIEEYCSRLVDKNKECEELKKQLDTSEKWRIKAEGLNEKLELKNTRYLKVLEEIERIATTFRARESSYHNVLDIISKAKGEE